MAISATTSILTANDWQYAKDIRPGDWVFNRLGKPVKVKTAQTYRAEECYRVVFDDYLTIEGDHHTVMPIETPMYRRDTFTYQGKRRRRAKPLYRNIQEMLDEGLEFRGKRAFFSVPTTDPIQLPTQPLGIPPFVYGFWFVSRKGDQLLSVPLEFSDDVFEKFKDSGYQIENLGIYLKRYIKFRTVPSIWSQLRGENTRTVPLAYLNGSAEQRLEFLQGMLSAKPVKKVGLTGLFSLKTQKKHLITVYQFLSESLGAKTKIGYQESNKLYSISITRITPFLKQMAPERPVVYLARRYVKSIERIPAQLCVHIETDDEDGSFLAGEGFIPCL